MQIIDKNGIELTLKELFEEARKCYPTFDHWWNAQNFPVDMDVREIAEQAWKAGTRTEIVTSNNAYENYKRIEDAQKYGR